MTAPPGAPFAPSAPPAAHGETGAAGRLAAIAAEARRCTLCAADLPHGVRPVFQVGASARILIAGQAPGRRVHDSGRPFTDASGVRLRSWLGVSEAQFYDPAQFAILPMGFCYPGTAGGRDLPPRAECAPAWRQRMLDAMPGIEMTLVLGQYAQAWHLPATARARLSDAVQDWAARWPRLLLLPHPSPRNIGWFARNPWFEAELVPKLRAEVARLLAGAGGAG